LQKEKVRVYALARELNIESKDLVELCRQAGIDVKNQLSSLDPDQRDAVEQLVRRGGSSVATAAPPRPSAPVIPSLPTPVPNLSVRPLRRDAEVARAVVTGPAKPQEAAPPAPQPQNEPIATAAAKLPEVTTPRPVEAAPVRPPEVGAKVPDLGAKAPPATSGKIPDLGQSRPELAPRPHRKREIPRPGVPRIATPPPLKQRPLRDIKPAEPVAQKPIARPPQALKGGPVGNQDLVGRRADGLEVPPNVDLDEEEGGDGKKGGKPRPAGVAGRDKRHQQRNERARLRKDRGEAERPTARLLLQAEDDRPQRVKQRLRQAQQKRHGPTQPRKGKVPISLPITVRSLSEAVGVRSVDLLFKLKETGQALTINSTLDPDVAET
jgi:translation initiation factor IF-2